MDFTKLNDEIEKLKRTLDQHKESIKDSRCDKHGLGFNKDSRFSTCSINLSLDSWTGYYGDSGCYTSVRANDMFKEHFVEYLNNNVETIIKEVIKMMENDLQNYVGDEIVKTGKYLEKLKMTSNQNDGV